MPFPGTGGAHLGTAYADVELRLTKLEAGFKKANAGFEKFGRDSKSRMDKIAKGFESAGHAMAIGLTAPLVALGTAAVQTATRMDSLKRGLTAVAGSSAEAERQMKRLKEVARLPGLGMEEAIQGSIRLQAAGFSARTAERSLKAFGNAIATVGGGKAELEGVAMALGQMASKGKVFAEEINQLNERVPQIRKAMQEAFGTSNTEMLQKAGMTAKQFVDGVTLVLEKEKQVAGGAQNAFENLQDTAKQALTAIGDTLLPAVTRAVDKAGKSLEQFTEWWKSLSHAQQENIIKWGAWTAAAGIGILALGKAVATIGTLIEVIGGLNIAMATTTGAFTLAAATIGGAFVAIRYDILGVRSAMDSVADKFSRMPGFGPTGLFARSRPLTQAESEASDRAGMAMGRVATVERTKDLRATGALTGPAKISVPPWLKALQDRIKKQAAAAASKAKGGRSRKAKGAGTPEYTEGDFLFGTGDILRGAMSEWAQTAELMAGSAEWMSSMEEMSRSLRDSLTPITVDPLEGMFGGMNIDTIDGMSRGFDELRASFEGLVVAAEEGRRRIYESFAKGMFGNLSGMKNALGLGNLSSPERMGDQMKRLQQTWKKGFDWMGSFASNLADEFYYGFAEGLDKMFGRNPLGRALSRTISRWFDQMIQNSMNTLMDPNATGAEKGKAGTGLLGSIVGSAFGPIGGIVGGLFGGLFAEGGTMPGRKWSIVGERGPELVYPSTDSQVVPFSRLAGASPGGVTVNMGGVVIRETADADRVMDRIASRLQQMQRVR